MKNYEYDGNFDSFCDNIIRNEENGEGLNKVMGKKACMETFKKVCNTCQESKNINLFRRFGRIQGRICNDCFLKKKER